MPDAGQMTRPPLSSTSNCDPMSIAKSPIELWFRRARNNAKYTSHFRPGKNDVAAVRARAANLSGSAAAIRGGMSVDQADHQRDEFFLFPGGQRRDGVMVR